MKNFFQNGLLFLLRSAAWLQLHKSRPSIIGVTGSAGKSSTVQAIACVLKTKFSVLATKKGNSETGIPLEILNLPVDNYTALGWSKVVFQAWLKVLTRWPHYDLAVLELAIDSPVPPKNMSYHLQLVQPTVGVFLNVNSVHSQYFPGPDPVTQIAQEKGKLITSLPASGLAIISADHPQIEALTPRVSARICRFGIKNSADMKLLKHQVSLNKTMFKFSYKQHTYELVLPGQLHFQEAFGSFAAALLVGEQYGISIDAGMKALSQHRHLLPGRMSVFAGIHHSHIIDSTYNSSLEPTTAALKMLTQIATTGKKIAVLGDMRELGERAEVDHVALAKVAAQTADQVFLVGPMTRKYVYPYLLKKGKPVESFLTAYQAIDVIKSSINKDDLILLKGSQNTIFLEIIVAALLAHTDQDSPLLCRRGAYWDKQRAKLV